MKRVLRETVVQELLNGLLILLGVLSASMGLKGFLFSSSFIDGGVTGVSMLLSKISHVPLSFWLPVVNLPFVALGYKHLGGRFALRSTLGISGLTAALAFVPFPEVTPDPVLTAVFGGLFIGAGIGLAIRGGAVLDGTEIAALLISKRAAWVDVGEFILGFNVLLFLAAIDLLGVEAALYSILTYLAAARALEFVVSGLERYTAMVIVSKKSAVIREALTGELGRGVTVYKGYGGKSKEEEEILYCVVTRLEIGKVKAIVHAHDPAAFLTSHLLADVEGGVLRRSHNQLA